MFQRGVRGAITVESNTSAAIKVATVDLLEAIINRNSISTEDISHVIFTLTKDLNAAFPAKFARDVLGWNEVPMMCFNELDISSAINLCLRVLVVINTDKTSSEIKHVYLKDAKILRPDIY